MGKNDRNENTHIEIQKTVGKSPLQKNLNTLENAIAPNDTRNVAGMQMGIDNGSTFGTSARNQFGAPKPVRIVPIDIEINSDKIYSSQEGETKEIEISSSSQKQKIIDNKRNIYIKQESANNKVSQNLTSFQVI